MDQDQQPTHRQARLSMGRSNPYQTLLALFVTAFFFFMFQANILKNFQKHQQLLRNSGSEHHNKAKYQHRLDPLGFHQPHDIANREVNPKFARRFQNEEIGIKVNGTLLRGVKKDHRKYYLPNSLLMFVCFDGNATIPFSAVNNDFCDCSDGSDEPGTSACPNGRFYCEPERIYLPSSRVNDGLCDCCDGSDEWKGVTVAPDAQLPDSDKVQRAPCRDVCNDYEHERMLQATLRHEGIEVKQKYIYAGKDAPSNLYGKDREYFKLSQECYMYKSPNYIYEICPYRNASQIGKDTWLIGSGGVLDVADPNHHSLNMPNGAQDHCPGEARKTIIQFTCGPADEVKYVSETHTCVYTVKFTTPAACPNTEEDT